RGVPTPVGQKKAPMPAPAALIRSARFPCGTTSSWTLPARYSPSNTYESDCRGNEQMTLVTRPAASRAARPVSPLPALLLTMVRSVAPCSINASISVVGMPAIPNPPTRIVARPGFRRRPRAPYRRSRCDSRPIPLLLVKVGQHLGSDPERRIGIRHTAVDRGLHQEFFDLIVGQPVTTRGAQMHLQLVVMAPGYQGGECDQRPAAAVQALSRPDCAPSIFGDEPLKFRSEVGGRRCGSVDMLVAEDFAPHGHARVVHFVAGRRTHR